MWVAEYHFAAISQHIQSPGDPISFRLSTVLHKLPMNQKAEAPKLAIKIFSFTHRSRHTPSSPNQANYLIIQTWLFSFDFLFLNVVSTFLLHSNSLQDKMMQTANHFGFVFANPILHSGDLQYFLSHIPQFLFKTLVLSFLCYSVAFRRFICTINRWNW